MKHHLQPGKQLVFRRTVSGKEKKQIFVVDEFLGSGSQADVYSGHLQGDAKKYAVKHLYGDYSSDPERYYEKVKILASCAPPHPDIVWPLAVTKLTKSNCFCILMELVEGDYRSFSYIVHDMMCRNTVTEGPVANSPAFRPRRNPQDPGDPAGLTVQQRAQAACRAAEIIAALHRCKMIHTDISCKNLCYCVQPDGMVCVKMIDADCITPEGSNAKFRKGYSLGVNGTFTYLASELLTGSSGPTMRSDRYALGVVCYRLLLGSLPLDGKEMRDVPYTRENIKRVFSEGEFAVHSRTNTAGPVVMRNYQALPIPVQQYFDVMFSRASLRGELVQGNDPRLPAEILVKALKIGFQIP